MQDLFFILLMNVSLRVCICAMCMECLGRPEEGAGDSGMGLQMVVRHRVGARNQIRF